MAYIKIDQYLDWGGTLEDESSFDRLSYRAERLIDRYTQGRIKKMSEVPEEVKRCMVELINAMSNADPTEIASKPALSSFNNDGYSESYTAVTTGSLATAFYGVICDYLAEVKDDNGTPLLWLGVD